jgi:hypothetical protein
VPVGVMCGTVPYQAVGWSACRSATEINSASPLLILSHPAAPRMQLARIMQHRSTSWPPQTASRHIPPPMSLQVLEPLTFPPPPGPACDFGDPGEQAYDEALVAALRHDGRALAPSGSLWLCTATARSGRAADSGVASWQLAWTSESV